MKGRPITTTDGRAQGAAPPQLRMPFLGRVRALALRPPVYLGFLLLVAVAAAVHMLLLGAQPFPVDQAFPYGQGPRLEWAGRYTHINNFLIFKQSFAHLAAGKDLYAAYPAEHFDYYKYSPTFAALMAPFAFLPVSLGAVLWNLLNACVLAAALFRLPVLDSRVKGLVAWYITPEFLGAAQNVQTNILLLGLLLLAFSACERREDLGASLAIVLAFYVKIFGLLAAVLFLLYPQRKRLVLLTAGWVLVLGLLPLAFVSPRQLAFLYQGWVELLQADRLTAVGFSAMGWLRAWFGFTASPLLVPATGLALTLLPFANRRGYADFHFRLALFASVLLYVVVFNHKAESSTFVIAMCGAALWYFSRPRKTWRALLLWSSFLFTSVAYSDLTPNSWKARFVIPLVLKVVALLAVWLAAVLEGVFSSWALASHGDRAADRPGRGPGGSETGRHVLDAGPREP